MELHVAYHASSPIEAQLAKGRLEAEGLHPVIPGEGLNDEFGVAGRLAGTIAVRVLVPASEAEAAARALEGFDSDENLDETEVQ